MYIFVDDSSALSLFKGGAEWLFTIFLIAPVLGLILNLGWRRYRFFI